MSWIISKRKCAPDQSLSHDGRYHLVYDKGESLVRGDITVIVSGYIIPRLETADQYRGMTGPELVFRLLEDFGEDFICRIKGVFSLIIIDPAGFKLYCDTHGMSRFFYWHAGDDFIFSDRIGHVRSYCSAEPDIENLALYTLTEHFIPGMTAFRGVDQSMPATRIIYDGSLRTSVYWDPGKLLEIKGEKRDISFYAERWKQLIRGYLNVSYGGNVNLTLTGGSDSRMVLAGLLANGFCPAAFTYGDPASGDAVIAEKVASRLGIDHAIHYFPDLTASWQKEIFLRLTEEGDTLVNLHRAHMYQAALDEREPMPRSDILYTGLMGGEYQRGPRYDGYIISKYFREAVSGKDRLNMALKMLGERSFEINNLDKHLLDDRLQQMGDLFRGQKKEKEFRLAHYIYGCAHHYQDTRIFSLVFRKVANPFMDPDFLEMIAASGDISFKRSGRLGNVLWPSRFQVMITHKLLPAVSDIPYGKRGLYTAGDLVEKPHLYFMKRLKALTRERTYPSSFRHGEWMKEFVSRELQQLSPVVSGLFRVKEISVSLRNTDPGMSEKQWHYFTNPVNLSQIFK